MNIFIFHDFLYAWTFSECCEFFNWYKHFSICYKNLIKVVRRNFYIFVNILQVLWTIFFEWHKHFYICYYFLTKQLCDTLSRTFFYVIKYFLNVWTLLLNGTNIFLIQTFFSNINFLNIRTFYQNCKNNLFFIKKLDAWNIFKNFKNNLFKLHANFVVLHK